MPLSQAFLLVLSGIFLLLGLGIASDLLLPGLPLAFPYGMAYLYQAAVCLAAHGMPRKQRRILTSLILVWHLPIAIRAALAASFVASLIHACFVVLALASLWLAGREEMG